MPKNLDVDKLRESALAAQNRLSDAEQVLEDLKEALGSAKRRKSESTGSLLKAVKEAEENVRKAGHEYDKSINQLTRATETLSDTTRDLANERGREARREAKHDRDLAQSNKKLSSSTKRLADQRARQARQPISSSRPGSAGNGSPTRSQLGGSSSRRYGGMESVQFGGGGGGWLDKAEAAGDTIAMTGKTWQAKLVGAGISAAASLGKVVKEIKDSAVRQQIEINKLASLRYMEFGDGSKANYGKASALLPGSVDEAFDAYSSEATNLGKVFGEAYTDAIYFGLSTEQRKELASSMARIGYETGESYQKGVGSFFNDAGPRGGIAFQVAELSATTGKTVEEITSKYIRGVKQYGLSWEEALHNIREVGDVARDVSVIGMQEGMARGEKDPTRRVISTEEFSDAVQDVRGTIDSLVVTEEAVARLMKAGLLLSQKTNLTNKQSIEAAKRLTEALTSGYDEGFATVEAPADMEFLLKKYEDLAVNGNEAQRAAATDKLKTLNFLKGQNLDPAMLASMLDQSGFSTDLFERRAVSAATSGNVRLMQAHQKTPITPEQLMLLAQLADAYKSGDDSTVQSLLKDLMDAKQGKGAEGDKGLPVRAKAAKGFIFRSEAVRGGSTSLDELKDAGQDIAAARALGTGGAKLINEVKVKGKQAIIDFAASAGTKIPGVDDRVAASARVGKVQLPTGRLSKQDMDAFKPGPATVTVSKTGTTPNGNTSVTFTVDIPTATANQVQNDQANSAGP